VQLKKFFQHNIILYSFTLARFDFVMHHRPSKTMGKSDALSRRADHGSGSDDNQDITLLTPNFFAVWATEGLEVVGEERDLLKLIWRETKSEELEDTVKLQTSRQGTKNHLGSLHPLLRMVGNRRGTLLPQ